MANKEFKAVKQLLKEFVKEYSIQYGTCARESYHEELLDDLAYVENSVYVPLDIKKKINKWACDMGLSTSKNKNR